MQKPRKPHLEAVRKTLRYSNLRLLDLLMLIGQEILLQKVNKWIHIHLGELFPGVARNNQLLHCHLQKQNIELQQWQLRLIQDEPRHTLCSRYIL
ncbi:LOW QUALITY PROTEIN: hypothetical protein V2J09_000458 [Rumex salicifolius]